MKILLTLVVLLVVLSSVNFAQYEEPTAKQCRADYEAWHSLPMDELTKPPFTEIQRRETEMSKCRFEDQDNLAKYVLVLHGLEYEKGRRWFRFIDRHGYTKQFMQEDDQGER